MTDHDEIARSVRDAVEASQDIDPTAAVYAALIRLAVGGCVPLDAVLGLARDVYGVAEEVALAAVLGTPAQPERAALVCAVDRALADARAGGDAVRQACAALTAFDRDRGVRSDQRGWGWEDGAHG